MTGIDIIERQSAGQALLDGIDQFVLAHPEATFYHSSRYHAFLLDLLGARCHSLVALRGGEVVGILPLMTVDGPCGVVVNSLPFYGSYGGVLAAEPSFASLLWEHARALIERLDVTVTTVVSNPFAANADGIPGEPMDYRLVQYTDISGGANRALEDTEWLHRIIDSSTRRNIRKAHASGVEVRTAPEAMSFLRQAHLEGMAAIGGRPKSDRFFALIDRHFRPDEDYKLYVASIGGEPVAALLLFLFRDYAEYFVPATIEAAREAQPMAAILERAMAESAAAGIRIWNWGGTWETQTGVYRFKRKWGAAERRYDYFVDLRRPERIRGQTPQSLIDGYGNFYVVPFRLLSEREDEQS